MTEQSLSVASKKRWRWWQKLLGIIAVVLAVFLLFNPEFAAFWFVADAAFLDVFFLLISVQLQFFRIQLSTAWATFRSRIAASKGPPVA